MHVFSKGGSLTHIYKVREPFFGKTKIWLKNPRYVWQSPTEMLFQKLPINRLSSDTFIKILLEKQFVDISMQVKLIFNSIWQGFLIPYFILELGIKMNSLPHLFSNLYFNETLHEDSMPSRSFKNVEIWALVTHIIIAMTSSLIRNKLALLKNTNFLKNKL